MDLRVPLLGHLCPRLVVVVASVAGVDDAGEGLRLRCILLVDYHRDWCC